MWYMLLFTINVVYVLTKKKTTSLLISKRKSGQLFLASHNYNNKFSITAENAYMSTEQYIYELLHFS